MIKLCKYNPFHLEIIKQLEINKVQYSLDACIYRCNVCHMYPIAFKDDKFISAASVEELIKKLKL